MATTPIEVEEQPSTVQRVREAVTAPVTQRRPRLAFLLASAAGLASLAPVPFGPIAAAIIVGVAFETGRQR